MVLNSGSRTTEGGAESAARDEERIALFAGVRTRVLVFFLALLVISTAASVLVLRQVLLSRIGDQVERELLPQVETLRALSEQGRQNGEPFAGLEQLFQGYLDRTAAPSDGALVAFISGEPFAANVSGPAAAGLETALLEVGAEGAPASGTLNTEQGEATYITIPVAAGDERGQLVVAALTAAEREQVEAAVRIAVGVSIVVLLLASLFIWLAAGRAIAPLKALSRTARTISDTDLSSRIPVRGGDEIAELGRTFNSMLDRLETAFADQKDFLTDVGHELRTPITVIRGHVETLGNTQREREEAISVIQDELERMSRYVDDLLLLTKAPRPDFLRLGPVDLDLFTHDLFAKAGSLGERDWRLEGTGVGIVFADQHRLTQAVMNLADNAVRHTRPDEPIWLGSSLSNNHARLWIRDAGPGVDPADRDRIFARYVRAKPTDRSRADGAGLGLSIVRAIAEAHGGWAELDSAPGKGSTFTIVVPTMPEP